MASNGQDTTVDVSNRPRKASKGSQDSVSEDDDDEITDEDFKMRAEHGSPRKFASMFEMPKEKIETKPAASMFQDVDDMKAKVRQGLMKEQYDVRNFYKTTGFWQKVARSSPFENITLAVIGFNALWISIDTDNNTASTLLEAEWQFQMMEHAFCVYFTGEWFFRFMAFKRKRDGLRDGWFVFDSCLVAMMVGETWIMTLVLVALGGGAGGGLGNASILRLVRLLRLSRMARMARLLRAMPELMILIKGMVSAFRSVMFTLCLLFIFIYVFSIALRQLSEDTPAGEKYFKSITDAMYTLIVDGTLLDNIGGLLKVCGESGAHLSIIVMLFVLLAALTVMNMLIGVLCEVVSLVAATEQEEMTVSFVKHRIQEIMRDSGIDQDGNGSISRTEFQDLVGNAMACRVLSEVGVDPIGLVDLADMIFDSDAAGEDNNGKQEEIELSFEDFMEVVLQLRGSNSATVKDIMDMRKYVRRLIDPVLSHIKTVEKNLEAADKKLEVMRSGRRMSTQKSSISLGQTTASSRAASKTVASETGQEDPMSPGTSPLPVNFVPPMPQETVPLPPQLPDALLNPNRMAMNTSAEVRQPAPNEEELKAWLAWCEKSLQSRQSELAEFAATFARLR